MAMIIRATEWLQGYNSIDFWHPHASQGSGSHSLHVSVQGDQSTPSAHILCNRYRDSSDLSSEVQACVYLTTICDFQYVEDIFASHLHKHDDRYVRCMSGQKIVITVQCKVAEVHLEFICTSKHSAQLKPCRVRLQRGLCTLAPPTTGHGRTDLAASCHQA